MKLLSTCCKKVSIYASNFRESVSYVHKRDKRFASTCTSVTAGLHRGVADVRFGHILAFSR